VAAYGGRQVDRIAMDHILETDHAILTGIWLSSAPVETPIETLLLQMLEANQPNPRLRQAFIEELHRGVKRKAVVLEYLGLQEVGTDQDGEITLHLVSPEQGKALWQAALLTHQGHCPIGFVFLSWDQGQVVVVHEVFQQLTPPQQELIRKYAALAAQGMRHEGILPMLGHDEEADRYSRTILEARRRMRSLDQSVLLSPDGDLRVQVGSISQTTKNILREGITGNYLFILPKHLFEGKTNYADIEFVVYLNFFVRNGVRTRIAGRARQKETLERLLNLTLFGLFNAHATEPPSFAKLRRTYGVPDQETLAFFHMCYERYAVRRGYDPTGPILGFEDYVDFVLLGEEGQPTRIPITTQGVDAQPLCVGTVEVVPQYSGVFDVRITQPDDKCTAKRLIVTPPLRAPGTIQEAQYRTLQFATDRPRFGVTPLGTSHGFDPMGDLTSFVIWINGHGILVDPSPEALRYLEQIGVAQTDLLYVFLTHIHADHDGGLIEKLLSGSRTTIIASDVVFRSFVQKAQLVTGHDFRKECLVEHISANPGRPVVITVTGERVELETRWNLHPIPTNGFKLTIAEKCFGYSADTQYDAALIHQLQEEKKLSQQQVTDLLYFFWTPDGTPKVDLLYHEAGIPPIHTDRQKLELLPAAVQAKTALVHIADRDVPPGAPMAKPPLFTTHMLLPSTEQSRQGIVLRTLALVSYLYDIPAETIKGLADRAHIRVFERDEVIIRQGPMKQGETLSFFVVADGEVAVKDGRRLIIKLSKADSFGEWGISHQRGFRAADVVAARRTQLIELDEEAYHWMVTTHPVIQVRIGKIRTLLPKLQLAQARAIRLSREEPLRIHSVIEEMNATQLSAFAVFSEVKRFDQGMPVMLEGESADGFYILLSGHLMALAGGKVVGELSEGDVFGEMGLMEGGKRTATIEVVSADAEVLRLSQENFDALLQTVPAFSFELRATAAQRHEMDHT
jgi:CRP-like cAMP-binding protein